MRRIKMNLYDAMLQAEAKLWNEMMIRYEDSEGTDEEARKVLRIINEYNEIIHEKMIELFGENYREKFK
jgi:lysozyme family protein